MNMILPQPHEIYFESMTHSFFSIIHAFNGIVQILVIKQVFV